MTDKYNHAGFVILGLDPGIQDFNLNTKDIKDFRPVLYLPPL